MLQNVNLYKLITQISEIEIEICPGNFVWLWSESTNQCQRMVLSLSGLDH